LKGKDRNAQYVDHGQRQPIPQQSYPYPPQQTHHPQAISSLIHPSPPYEQMQYGQYEPSQAAYSDPLPQYDLYVSSTCTSTGLTFPGQIPHPQCQCRSRSHSRNLPHRAYPTHMRIVHSTRYLIKRINLLNPLPHPHLCLHRQSPHHRIVQVSMVP
jgi:hypothetical protein